MGRLAYAYVHWDEPCNGGWAMARCRIFVSYAHADEKAKNSRACVGEGFPRAFWKCLQVVLDGFGGRVSRAEVFFDVERLNAEREWNDAIESALDECELFIFLVSMHALGSNYCLNKELATAAVRGVTIVPVVLTPWGDWTKFEIKEPDSGKVLGVLGQYHSAGLPKDGAGNCLAVSEWTSEYKAWDEVRAGLTPILRNVFGNTPATAAGSNAVPEPWPEWPPDEAAFLEDCRHRLVGSFAEPVLRRCLGSIFDHPAHNLPGTVGRALLVPPEKAGESACKALLILLNDLSRRLKERTLAMSREDCALVRDRFKAAFGAAARMCLDPNVMCAMGLDGPEDAALCRRLPATEVAGATLAVRAEPHKSWKRPGNIGGAALEDGRAIPVTIELGDTQSAGRSLAMVLHQSCYPAAVSPTELDDQTIGRLRGEAEVNAMLGEARYFVLPTEQDSRLTPELESWVVAQLATGVLVRQSANSAQPLFRYSEKTLLALIGRALAILDEPEWNPS